MLDLAGREDIDINLSFILEKVGLMQTTQDQKFRTKYIPRAESHGQCFVMASKVHKITLQIYLKDLVR